MNEEKSKLNSEQIKRLLIVIKASIAEALENYLYEPNQPDIVVIKDDKEIVSDFKLTSENTTQTKEK